MTRPRPTPTNLRWSSSSPWSSLLPLLLALPTLCKCAGASDSNEADHHPSRQAAPRSLQTITGGLVSKNLFYGANIHFKDPDEQDMGNPGWRFPPTSEPTDSPTPSPIAPPTDDPPSPPPNASPTSTPSASPTASPTPSPDSTSSNGGGGAQPTGVDGLDADGTSSTDGEVGDQTDTSTAGDATTGTDPGDDPTAGKDGGGDTTVGTDATGDGTDAADEDPCKVPYGSLFGSDLTSEGGTAIEVTYVYEIETSIPVEADDMEMEMLPDLEVALNDAIIGGVFDECSDVEVGGEVGGATGSTGGNGGATGSTGGNGGSTGGGNGGSTGGDGGSAVGDAGSTAGGGGGDPFDEGDSSNVGGGSDTSGGTGAEVAVREEGTADGGGSTSTGGDPSDEGDGSNVSGGGDMSGGTGTGVEAAASEGQGTGNGGGADSGISSSTGANSNSDSSPSSAGGGATTATVLDSITGISTAPADKVVEGVPCDTVIDPENYCTKVEGKLTIYIDGTDEDGAIESAVQDLIEETMNDSDVLNDVHEDIVDVHYVGDGPYEPDPTMEAIIAEKAEDGRNRTGIYIGIAGGAFAIGAVLIYFGARMRDEEEEEDVSANAEEFNKEVGVEMAADAPLGNENDTTFDTSAVPSGLSLMSPTAPESFDKSFDKSYDMSKVGESDLV